jgi:hypothetical protein
MKNIKKATNLLLNRSFSLKKCGPASPDFSFVQRGVSKKIKFNPQPLREAPFRKGAHCTEALISPQKNKTRARRSGSRFERKSSEAIRSFRG